MIEDFAQLLIEVAEHFGIRSSVTSMHRTRREQEALFRARDANSPLPAARPGTSTHEYGLAFDLVALDPANQEVLGLIGEAIGLYWGGRFRRADPVHFQIVSPGSWANIIHRAGA